jgi:hypothetical protein
MAKLFIILCIWFGVIAAFAFDGEKTMRICQEQHSFEFCQTQLR